MSGIKTWKQTGVFCLFFAYRYLQLYRYELCVCVCVCFSLYSHANFTSWVVLFAEGESCEYGSAKFFALCGFGGILSCGITHTAVVPLDLVKCRMQVDPDKYGNIIKGFRVTLQESGVRELGKGWAPTFFGYSMQGLGKFGFYEIFKVLYSGLLGEVCKPGMEIYTY